MNAYAEKRRRSCRRKEEARLRWDAKTSSKGLAEGMQDECRTTDVTGAPKYSSGQRYGRSEPAHVSLCKLMVTVTDAKAGQAWSALRRGRRQLARRHAERPEACRGGAVAPQPTARTETNESLPPARKLCPSCAPASRARDGRKARDLRSNSNSEGRHVFEGARVARGVSGCEEKQKRKSARVHQCIIHSFICVINILLAARLIARRMESRARKKCCGQRVIRVIYVDCVNMEMFA